MSGAFLKLAIFLRPLLTVPPAWKSAMMLAVTDRGSIVKKEGVVTNATELKSAWRTLGHRPSEDTEADVGHHGLFVVLIEN